MQTVARIGREAESIVSLGGGEALNLISALGGQSNSRRREVDDARACLQAAKGIDELSKSVTKHLPTYSYTVHFFSKRTVGKVGNTEYREVAYTEPADCSGMTRCLLMSTVVGVDCPLAGNVPVSMTELRVTLPSGVVLTAERVFPDVVKYNYGTVAVQREDRISLALMFNFRQIFQGASRPKFMIPFRMAPEAMISRLQEEFLGTDKFAAERATADCASRLLQRKAGKVLAKAAVRAVKGEPVMANVNTFAVLAEENPDAAYVAGYIGVPTPDPAIMRVLHSLRVNDGFRRRRPIHNQTPAGEAPRRDTNWRSCIRRLKRKSLKMKPVSTAYVLGACQGNELPSPMRAALKKNLRASSARYVSLRLLRSKYFRPLTFDQNVTVVKTFGEGVLPKPLRARFLKLADSCSPTAYKARASGVGKK